MEAPTDTHARTRTCVCVCVNVCMLCQFPNFVLVYRVCVLRPDLAGNTINASRAWIKLPVTPLMHHVRESNCQ